MNSDVVLVFMAKSRFGLNRALTLIALAILLTADINSANAAPAQLVVLLFQADLDSDRVFLDGPFAISKPNSQHFAPRHYQIAYKNGYFEITELNQQLGKPQRSPQKIRAPFLLLETAGSRFISIGRRKDKIRHYFGAIRLSSPDGKKIECRNLVSRRDYVTCVVGSESPPEFPVEALKALSVLIQTASLRYNPEDRLNDTTEKQAYMGADYARPEVIAAVQQTWGQKLLCGDQLVPIYFHGTCAGGTSSSEIFMGKKSKLACDKAVICKHCSDSPFSKTLIRPLPASEFEKRIAPALPQVQTKDSSNRPLQLIYPNGKTETGYQLWLRIGQTMGWGLAPGTRFELSKSKNGDYEIRSNGAGHGVGLCQWGSQGLAKKGWDYRKILQFYFPSSRVVQES